MTDLQNVSQSVASIYASALLDLAGTAGSVEDVRQETDELVALIAEQPDLAKLLTSRVLSKDERRGSIERIFSGRVNDLLYRFIQVVNSKGRLAELADILTTFAKLVDKRAGIMEVDAFVAAELDAETAQRIAADLSQTLGGNVILHQHVDASLLGGMKLRIGDRLIDASVVTQLRKMKKQIVEAGREKTRGKLDQYLTA